MKLVQLIEKAFRFNEAHIKLIVAGLSQEQMSVCPAKGLENHPAWTIGHLYDASEMSCKLLDGENKLSEAWIQLFRRTGPGDPRVPSTDSSLYPSKNILLDKYIASHNEVLFRLNTADDKLLNAKIDWSFESSFPTLIELIHFMATWHEIHHIAQLEAWRRGMGFATCLRPLANQLKR